jgi:hypothetical protein
MSHIFQNPKPRLILMGAEGEGLESELLHFRKHRNVALNTFDGLFPSAVADEKEFKKIWRKDMIGIGDLRVYEKVKALAVQKNTLFPSWRQVEVEINAYYREHLGEAKVIKGFDETKAMMKDFGVIVMLVTHAPPPLLADQLERIENNTDPRVTFEPWEIVQGKRKDQTAYADAVEIANAHRAKGTPRIKFEEVLVLDASRKYLKKAAEYGMYTGTIASKCPAYLMPEKAETIDLPRYLGVLRWSDIPRFIVKGLSPQTGGAQPSLQQ